MSTVRQGGSRSFGQFTAALASTRPTVMKSIYISSTFNQQVFLQLWDIDGADTNNRPPPASTGAIASEVFIIGAGAPNAPTVEMIGDDYFSRDVDKKDVYRFGLAWGISLTPTQFTDVGAVNAPLFIVQIRFGPAHQPGIVGAWQ